MAELIGQETFSDYGTHSQVYLATHNGEGNRLPHVNRAYISFSYGGKFIEDFGLLATMDDRLNKNLYADFEDVTTNYDTLDGQYYWGTHYTVNQLEFTLSTDGITQNQLEKFRQYFKPGIERELILAEHPNRAIMARVASVPSISMIPFETTEEISLNNVKYTVSTALYRGDITLAFTSDEPHWYGKLFYMPQYLDLEKMEGTDTWSETVEENGESVTKIPYPNAIKTLGNPDCMKMCLEDYLPYSAYLPARTFFGNNHYLGSEVAAAPRVGEALVSVAVLGITIENKTGATIGDDSDSSWYVFYSGTAPSKPTIKFTIQMSYDENGYIVYPKSKDKIATIQVGNRVFKYGLPSLLAGYNQAIKILIESKDENRSLIEIQERFRDEIKESRMRAYAITIVKQQTKEGTYDSMMEQMKGIFVTNNNNNNTSNTGPIVTYEIHSDTGEAYGFYNLTTTAEKVKQNVGDMIRSEYLIIDERSNFFPGKNITADDCLRIISSEVITDFLILFKNMYL